jgi:putative flippase GtrA
VLDIARMKRTKLTGSRSELVRFIRFLLVGGLNTVFGFAAYSSLIMLGAPTWAALVLGHTAGILFNFFTVGRLVFRSFDLARLGRFTGCYLAVLAVNLQLIHWMMIVVPNPIAAQALLVLPIAALSYLLMSRFVFRSAD